jgi:hypothetical protein
MKHEKFDDKARVWIVTRGLDGRLEERLDPQFLTTLGAATAEDIINSLAMAGEMEIRENRLW